MTDKKTKVDETGLDKDLDFEDFDMGLDSLSDDREPTSKPVRSFVRGVSKGLGDSEVIEKVLQKNLPREYTAAYENLQKFSRGSSDFADEVMKEAKPIVGDLANAADKFLPKNFKRTKEKLANIVKWSQGDERPNAPSKEDIRENTLSIELGRIFEQQQEQAVVEQKTSKADKALDRSISITQHQDISALLAQISNSSSKASTYQTTINAAWQRKSLESQYRQIFLLQDILEETKTSNAEMIGNLISITKNSALPEYRKTQKDEAFMDETRKRFSSKIVDAGGQYVENAMRKFKEDVRGGMQLAGGMTGMLSTMSEMSASMDEMDPQTLTDKLAEGMGGSAGKWLTAKTGVKIFEWAKKNPKIVDAIVKGKQAIGVFQESGAGILKDKLDELSEGDTILAGLATYVRGLADFEKADNTLQRYSFKDMYQPTPFTNKVAMSITDVIPGFLSRILQEQTKLRMGMLPDFKGEVDEVKFDFRKGAFTTSAEIIKSVKSVMSAKKLSSSKDHYFTEIMSSIENEVDLTRKERSDIAYQLLQLGVSGEAVTPGRMTDLDAWSEKFKSPETAEKFTRAMRGVFGTDSDKEYLYDHEFDPRKKQRGLAMAKQVGQLKYLRQDLSELAQSMVDTGSEKEARAAGLIDAHGNVNINTIDRLTTMMASSYRGKGSVTIDDVQQFQNQEVSGAGFEDNMFGRIYNKGKKVVNKVYNREDDLSDTGASLLTDDGDDDKKGDSDENIKDHIKPTGDVLGPISRLPIFNWQYKKGKLDSGATTNIGPMAQAMNDEFGEEVAPGSKKIDLVNANGITMKAIQELNTEVKKTQKNVFKITGEAFNDDDVKAGGVSGIDALRGILANTTVMVNQNKAMINISAEGLKNVVMGLGTSISNIDYGKIGAEAAAAYKEAGEFVKSGKATTLLGSLGDHVQNFVSGATKDGLHKAKVVGWKMFEVGKKANKMLGDTYTKYRIKALETFDTYVEGEEEPRMTAIQMRQDMYVDFKTKDVVRTRAQVRNIKGPIVLISADRKPTIVLRVNELENVYFVNTFKSAIERAYTGAKTIIKDTVRNGIDDILKPMYRNAKAVGESVKNLAYRLVDAPTDLFVDGDFTNAVIIAKKMIAGAYVDVADREPITRPSQIKGAVYDLELQRIVVTNEDYQKGLVDIMGKPISRSPMMRLAGTAAKLALGAGSAAFGWSLARLKQAPGVLGRLTERGTNMLKKAWSKLGFPTIDISGLFGAETVDILKDIRSILRYQAGLGGTNVNLDKIADTPLPTPAPMPEDAKGDSVLVPTPAPIPVDASPAPKPMIPAPSAPPKPITGKEILGSGVLAKTATQLGISGRALNSPEVVKALVAGAMQNMTGDFGANTPAGKVASMAMRGGSLITGLGSNYQVGKTNVDTRNQSAVQTQTVDSGVNGLALAGGALATGASLVSGAVNRLRGRRGRGGANDDAEAGAANDTPTTAKDRIATAFDALREKWTKPAAATATAGAKPQINVDAQGKAVDADGNRMGSWQQRTAANVNVNAAKEIAKADVKVYATKNIFKMIADTVGAVKKKLGDWMGRSGDPQDLAEDIADSMGDSDDERRKKRGRKGKAKGKGRLGKMGGKLGVGTAMRGLGYAGAAYSAYGAYENVKEGNYGAAAVDAGIAAGTAAASTWGIGATAAAVGTGLAWMGGGILTAVTSPAWLTGAAVVAGLGAAAYGGYKLYDYITRKEFSIGERVRMSEYGLRGGDVSLMRTVFELETYMLSVSKMTPSGLVIDDAKFDLAAALKIFGIGSSEQNRALSFSRWFSERFKPIYAKWRNIIQTVSGGDKLEWLEKASAKDQHEAYKLFKMSPEAYTSNGTPFADTKINNDISVIRSMVDGWLLSLRDVAVKTKDEALGRDIATTGRSLLDAREAGNANATGADSIDHTADKSASSTLPGQGGSKFQAASDFTQTYVPSTIRALDAVRYKSYGMVVIKASTIAAFRNLEAIVNDSLKINPAGQAMFDGEVADVISKAGGYFGLSKTDTEYTAKWTNWFTNRFLPVYLAFHSATYAFSRKIDIRANVAFSERILASQALVVARAMTGAKGIWEIKDYAFKGSYAGQSAVLCKENMAFLEAQAKEEPIREEGAGKAATTPPLPPAVQKLLAPVSANVKKAADSPFDKILAASGSTEKYQRKVNDFSDSDESEDPKVSNAGGGRSASGSITSNAAPGSLPLAAGELFSGAGGMEFVKIGKNARLDGVHPSLRRLFLGMAEEYGKLTGKSLTLNQGFRSYAEQARLYKESKGSGKAARPGTSLHEFGLALDVQSTDLEALEKMGLLRKYGFTRPLGSETWHIESAGIHNNAVRQRAKQDHAYATSFIESGIGRGGGGLGARGKGGQVKRSDDYAKQLFDAASRAMTAKDDTPAPPGAPSENPITKMTSAATTGATSSLATGQIEDEFAEGKTPDIGGTNTAKTLNTSIKDANDDLANTSYDITSQVKTTTGAYNGLPESSGTGWSGNGLLIKAAADLVGVDPGLGAAIAAKESSLNPSARGKSADNKSNVAQGLYQFMPGTWSDMMRKHAKRYGIPANATPMDARANALLGLEYIKSSLSRGDGSAVSGYLGHMLGPGGATRFNSMRDNDIPSKIMTGAAGNNPYVFFKDGDRSQPRTKAEMVAYLGQSINKQLSDFNIPLQIKATDVAANDTKAPSPGSSDVTEITKSTPTMVSRASYTPAPKPTARTPDNSSVQSLADVSPVPSSVRAAPALANADNGMGRLEKVSKSQLDEIKITNTILREIKEVLEQGFSVMSAQAAAAQAPLKKMTSDEASTAPTNRNLSAAKAGPQPLPASYVQRRRA